MMKENELATIVVDAYVNIHKQLVPGLLESAYEAIVAFELGKKGFVIERQVPIPLVWNGMVVENSFRADTVIEKKRILELKSIERLFAIHKKRVLTYLRVSGLKLGLLLNCGEEFIEDGIVRLVNGLGKS